MTIRDDYPECYGHAKAQLGFALSVMELAIMRLKDGAVDAATSLLSVEIALLKDELEQLDKRDKERSAEIVALADELNRQAKASAEVVQLRAGPVLIVDNEGKTA